MGHYSRFPLDADPGLQMLLPREQGSTGGPSIVGGSEYCGGGSEGFLRCQTRGACKLCGVGMVFITRCVQPPPRECFCGGGLLNLYSFYVAPSVT